MSSLWVVDIIDTEAKLFITLPLYIFPSYQVINALLNYTSGVVNPD